MGIVTHLLPEEQNCNYRKVILQIFSTILSFRKWNQVSNTKAPFIWGGASPAHEILKTDSGDTRYSAYKQHTR